MMHLETMRVKGERSFLLWLISNSKLRKVLKEYTFYGVRFYREERTADLQVLFDYPYCNMYWYLDFKKDIEQFLLLDKSYEDELKAFLSQLKSNIKDQFDSLKAQLDAFTAKDVVLTMNKYSLRDYQALDLLQLGIKSRMTALQAGLILSEQRTGKTRVAIAHICETMPKNSDIIVICPKSAVNGWIDEFKTMNSYAEYNGYEYSFTTLVYKHQRDVKAAPVMEGHYKIRIITYDLFKLFTYSQLRKAFDIKEGDNLMLIGDEIHRLRNFNTTVQSRSLFAFKDGCLGDKVNLHIVGLTGTPAVKSSSDMFGLFCLINSNTHLGFNPTRRDFDDFKEYFYNCEDTSYGKIARSLRRVNEMNFLMQMASVQTKTADLGMFKDYTKKYVKVDLEMSPEQREIYDSVRDTFIFKDDIDCMNAMVQLIRLQQICVAPSALVPSFDGVEPKIKWLMDFIHKKPYAKIIVFAERLDAFKILESKFNEEGIQYRKIVGSMSLKQRADAQNAYRTDKSVNILLMQETAGREALTLPETKVTVFLERDFVPGYNDQAESRMTPVDGVACTKYVVDLVMKDSVEQSLYDTLVSRKESVATVNDVFQILKKGG